MNERIVGIEYAKQDGFEFIALDKGKPISKRYQDYDEQNKQGFTYRIPYDRIEQIEKLLEESESSSDFFVKLHIENIDKSKQKICLEYHYSKSTYKYCYEVNGSRIIPKYSEYHGLSKDEKVKYKQGVFQ